MRIEYDNKFSDILLFNAVHQFLSPALQGVFVICCAFIFWLLLSEQNSLCAFVLACLIYFGLWVFQFLFNVVYLYSKKNGGILTKHIVEIQDEAFFEETKFNKSFFFWPGLVKVVSRPGFIAVYVTAHTAHVIPNRAFTSMQQRNIFLALVREKIRAAVPT